METLLQHRRNYKMKIEYEVTETSIKRVNADGTISWIPLDPANSDYQAYLATLASESANDPAGNK